MTIQSPLLRTDTESRSSLRDSVVGAKVAKVRYFPLETPPWPESRRLDFVHDAEHGVEIELGNKKVINVLWAQQGYDEGLAVHVRSVGEEPVETLRSVGVERTGEWRGLVGGKISGIRAAWSIPNEGCAEMLWALELRVRAARVTIALGATTESEVSYMPDEVIVIFDAEIARDYVTGDDVTWETL
jgi:hypothetical protein